MDRLRCRRGGVNPLATDFSGRVRELNDFNTFGRLRDLVGGVLIADGDDTLEDLVGLIVSDGGGLVGVFRCGVALGLRLGCSVSSPAGSIL